MGDALGTVAELMCIAARTAPKAGGEDFVVMEIIEGEAIQTLGKAMIRLKDRAPGDWLERDGKNVLNASVVVLIGTKDAKVGGLHCGACGEARCIKPNAYDGMFSGPQCAFKLLDMGIALGSAAKTASMLNADNRIMATVGVVAREIGLIDADFVIGIPLSATGKNTFFDRGS